MKDKDTLLLEDIYGQTSRQDLQRRTENQNNQKVIWEIELDSPEAYVEFEGDANADETELLDAAIAEMTRNTYIFQKRSKPIS